jgi:hypothetical protein
VPGIGFLRPLGDEYRERWILADALKAVDRPRRVQVPDAPAWRSITGAPQLQMRTSFFPSSGS